MNVIERTKELCAPVVQGMGYTLFDVTLERVEEDGIELTLLVDCERGITLDDCEKISRIVDPILEKENVIDEKFYLSVASVGLDHPSKIKGGKNDSK